MTQESKPIYEFKEGDIITRLKPSKPIILIGEEKIEDRQYIGEALKFISIANGCVYVEKVISNKSTEDENPTMDLLKMFFGDAVNQTINLPLDIWDEGWSYYVDPYSNVEKFTVTDETKFSKPEMIKKLKVDLAVALVNEAYEEAEKIKKKIEELT